MPEFICSECVCIETTSVADFYTQLYVEKKKPVCVKCKTGKHHNLFKQKVATVDDVLHGDIIHFENHPKANVIKNKMIAYITNYGKSPLPKEKFEKMTNAEILIIYRHLKGGQKP